MYGTVNVDGLIKLLYKRSFTFEDRLYQMKSVVGEAKYLRFHFPLKYHFDFLN